MFVIRDFHWTLPFTIFCLMTTFTLSRILDLSVDPLFLRNNVPPWVRFLFYWGVSSSFAFSSPFS